MSKTQKIILIVISGVAFSAILYIVIIITSKQENIAWQGSLFVAILTALVAIVQIFGYSLNDLFTKPRVAIVPILKQIKQSKGNSSNVEKEVIPFKPVSLDEVIIEVENMALLYVMLSPTGSKYAIRRWVGSLDKIYKYPSILSLKKLPLANLVNDLLKRYATKITYDEKIPILLILLGLLDEYLPCNPYETMTHKRIAENIKYLSTRGIIESPHLSEILVLLNIAYMDCYA